MSLSHALSQHLLDVHFGGNWTCVNVKETLTRIPWEEAIRKRDGTHTIAALAFHIHYYVAAQLRVLQGEPLDAHDTRSFDHPPLEDEAAWHRFLEHCWTTATAAAGLVAALPEHRLWEPFADVKYGTCYRNIQGAIEHAHYHLGQIVLLQKAARAAASPVA